MQTLTAEKKNFLQQTFILLIQRAGKYNIRIKSIAFTFSNVETDSNRIKPKKKTVFVNITYFSCENRC